MFLLTIVIAFALTLIVSLPNDWARRQAAEGITAVTTTLNVAGIAGIVLLCIKTGLANDAASVVALVVAIAVGGVTGNALATRVWGRARSM